MTMAKYLVLYQWYDSSSTSFIVADSKEQAIKEHVKLCSRLDCNYVLENTFGYGGSVSPFFMDYDDEEMDFEVQFAKFIKEYQSCFTVIELNDNALGLVTDKGFYQGERSIYNGEL